MHISSFITPLLWMKAIAFTLQLYFQHQNLNPAILLSYVINLLVIFTIYIILIRSTKNLPLQIKPLKHYVYVTMLITYIGLVFYTFNELNKLPHIGTLASLQKYDVRLGIVMQLGTAVLPALAILLSLNARGKHGTRFYLMMLTINNSYIAYCFLSKQLIIPVFVIMVVFRNHLQIGFIGRLLFGGAIGFLLFTLYAERGTGDETTIFFILERIMFRFVGLNETAVIIDYLMQNQPFLETNLRSAAMKITREVYGRSDQIGIAPGFFGFFIIQYGYILGSGLLIVYLYGLSLFAQVSNSKYGLYPLNTLLYYVMLLSSLHFMLDGTPSFITGTSGNIFFYLLCVMILLAFFIKLSAPRKFAK